MFTKEDLIEKLRTYSDHIESRYYPKDSSITLADMGDSIEEEPIEDLVEHLVTTFEGDDTYYDYDTVYAIGGGDYLILDYEEADELAEVCILDTVWAFNANFLQYYLCDGALTAGQIDALRGGSFEDINDAFLIMLGEKKKQFVKDAIWSDGRGHFISSYDGHEYEVGNYFVYRIN